MTSLSTDILIEKNLKILTEKVFHQNENENGYLKKMNHFIEFNSNLHDFVILYSPKCSFLPKVF